MNGKKEVPGEPEEDPVLLAFMGKPQLGCKRWVCRQSQEKPSRSDVVSATLLAESTAMDVGVYGSLKNYISSFETNFSIFNKISNFLTFVD